MKTLALSACLAAASTAPAAVLKDPALVAADWNKTIADARAPVLADGPLGVTVTPPVLAGSPATSLPRPHFKNDIMEVPPGWQVDPKMEHNVPGAVPPKGAKPWHYRGQTFWLIPIATSVSP